MSIALEPAASWTPPQVDGLLRVGRAAADDAPLEDLLSVIVSEASRVIRASGAGILLAEPGGRLGLGASVGLSDSYRDFLRGHFVAEGRSVARRAAESLRPVVIDDIALLSGDHDELGGRLVRQAAEAEGFRSLVSVPLLAGSNSFGVLTLYRTTPGEWVAADVELANTFAQHAAAAISSARLSDAKRRQVEALERLVAVLRDQTHEYANRLHALAGLHALGETKEANEFLARLMTLHHDNYATVIERVHHPVLAGLLVAQMSVARQRGVEVKLDRRTRIEALPEALGSAEAVTIVANLIDNAVEAVAQMPLARRKATVRFIETQERFTITVRDFGPGITPEKTESILRRGVSHKAGHAGIGLALVSEAVASANGQITIASTGHGTTFKVDLPRD